MAKHKVIGPGGKPIRGIPFATDLATIVTRLGIPEACSERDRSRFLTDLAKMQADHKTHQGNPETLRAIEYCIGLIRGQSPSTPQERAPAHVSASPPGQVKKLDQVLERAYQPPKEFKLGEIIRVDSIDNPQRTDGDYSTRIGSRRFFIKGDKPQKGTFAEITKVVRPGLLYEVRPIGNTDAAESLGIAAGQTKDRDSRQDADNSARYRKLEEHTRQLNAFAGKLEKDLQLPPIPEAQLAKVYTDAKKIYEQELQKLAPALDAQTNGLPESPVTDNYHDARSRVSIVNEQFAGLLTKLEQRVSQYDQRQKARGYDVKLPDTDAAKASADHGKSLEDGLAADKDDAGDEAGTLVGDAQGEVIRQYGVKIQLGKRVTGIVFPEDSLPKTPEDFYAYLRNENNFPERKDRETATNLLELMASGATVLYNGERLAQGADFRSAFSGEKSLVTVEEGRPVTRVASKTTVMATQGGRTG